VQVLLLLLLLQTTLRNIGMQVTAPRLAACWHLPATAKHKWATTTCDQQAAAHFSMHNSKHPLCCVCTSVRQQHQMCTSTAKQGDLSDLLSQAATHSQ
jgi:hypothetical protein